MRESKYCDSCTKELTDSFIRTGNVYICLDCLNDKLDNKKAPLGNTNCFLCDKKLNESEYDGKGINFCNDCYENSVNNFLKKYKTDTDFSIFEEDEGEKEERKNLSDIKIKDLLSEVFNENFSDIEAIDFNIVDEIMEEDFRKTLESELEEEEKKLENLSPVRIKKELDKYIIGQDYAKKVLSISLYEHQKRLVNNIEAELINDEDSRIEKTNIMLLGPTGVGKTATVKCLAKILDVPFTVVDASSLTSVGYIGSDVDDILSSLIDNAEGDIRRAEKGIVFLDEFDKLAKKLGSRPGMKDVGGEAVQQELLKIIEGTRKKIKNQMQFPSFESETVIDTSNILFILGGSFEGIQDIVKERLDKEKSEFNLGFGADVEKIKKDEIDLARELTTEDIKEFGIIPEIIGRAPIICVFEKLSLDELKRILVEPKNSMIDQLTRLIRMEDIDLVFEEEALGEIAQYGLKQGTGARGLKGILEKVTYPIRYNIPDKNIDKIIVTRDTVINPESYKVVKRKQEQSI